MNAEKSVLFEVRKSKLLELKDVIIPYADRFERSCKLIDAKKYKETDKLSLCGRVLYKRDFGKLIFIKLWDASGDFQVSFAINEYDDDKYNILKKHVKVGDFIGADGKLYRTKTGELTLKAESYLVLSKTLRAMPEKYHGLKNVNKRYRKRYLDIITNSEVRDVFIKRSKTIQYIREFLTENEFLEVETPILQPVASGAAARPFIAHHNALDMDLYMRIAPELYLKQVIAAGFDKVFEIGKSFRNEGMDSNHLQEFTMIEWYASYWNYEDNIVFIQKLLRSILDKVYGNRIVEFIGHTLDFGAEWERIDFCKAINNLIKSNILDYDNLGDLKAVVKKYDLLCEADINKSASIPALIDLLYKQRIRPHIIQPSILYNYPACLIPLARRNDIDNRVIDMFQIVICGWEIVKAYSELIDPVRQRLNFIEQAKNKIEGDDEAFEVDNDFLAAMEHGMPPMSGVGIGIDRLVAILCNQSSLRDVVLFPTMR